MWDQTEALKAHARLSALHARTFMGAKEPDADELPSATPKPQIRRGKDMTHLCRDCGVTDAKLFRDDMKSQCKKCKNRQQIESRTTARRSMKASAAAIVSRGRRK